MQEYGVSRGLDLRYAFQCFSNQTDFISDPCRYQCNTHDRRRGRVDDIGKFLPGDFQVIRQRAGRVSDDERIAVVIEENHYAHQPHRDLPTDGGFSASDHHAHNARHATITRDDANHAADH